MDGCSYPRIYWSIYMPLTIPGLVSLAIFVAVASWNDFLWPLIMTSSSDLQVVSIAISSFVGEYNTNYSLMMAGAVISILPLIILYLILQRHFIEGIALTGVKG
ncbi:carbohydrate ABC transporter permease [Gracilibacillus timonensis]|uniref:carbohydrate ABC transporter permease n=1 Tax=Gracilibacillus timonensis TaxID=1816696 RepID=UPI00098EF3FD|nr:ABC transporter permease subunit [Gracilibacillus timonensis]